MNKNKIKELYEKYELEKETDFWKKDIKNKSFVIITRSGIEKIQSKEQINVTYDALVVGPDYCAVKCTAEKNGRTIQTFSSALKGTGGNCFTSYVLEMAEKRAFARAVLKLTDFYQENVFGEDESSQFSKPTKLTIKKS